MQAPTEINRGVDTFWHHGYGVPTMSTTPTTSVIVLQPTDLTHDYGPRFIPALAEPPAKWETDRLCSFYPSELWTTYRGHYQDVIPGTEDILEQGQQICAECPSQPKCLAYALAAREGLNTWGGVTEWQRNRLAHKLRRSGRLPALEV